MNALLTASPHIVFDIGNVLLSFEPQRAMDELLPVGEHPLFRQFVLSGPEWALLDRGDLDNAGAVKAICRHKEMRGKEDMVMHFLRGFPATMRPLPAAGQMDRLHAMGKQIYALSNFHAEAFKVVSALHPFFAKLDGMVISSHVHCNKPDHLIYRLLLNKYGLKGEQCLFLDDVLENVQAAQAVGMRSLQYTCFDQIIEMLQE